MKAEGGDNGPRVGTDTALTGIRLVLTDPGPLIRKSWDSRDFLRPQTPGPRHHVTIPIMAGIKRKSAGTSAPEVKDKSKKVKVDKPASKTKSKHEVKPVKKAKKAKEESSSELDESDTSEKDNGFYGFSAAEGEDVDMSDAESGEEAVKANGKTQKHNKESDGPKKSKGDGVESKLAGLNGNTQQFIQLTLLANRPLVSNSREAHAKQKALANERKAAKPNADIIERSKKLWEKLRLKSHVDKEERKELVKELFDIITGRVKDFVFKHDSVRVIQTAIKYSTMEQRRMIARELKGEFKVLAEGKYSKFLIAKLVEKG